MVKKEVAFLMVHKRYNINLPYELFKKTVKNHSQFDNRKFVIFNRILPLQP